MKNKILKIFIGLFVLMPCVSYGVQPFNSGSLATKRYSGVVLDAANNQPLEGVNVSWAGDSSNGCYTIKGGVFNCDLYGNQAKVSFVGYDTQTISLVAGAGNTIKLTPGSVSLEDVGVVASGADNAKPVMRKPGKIESGVEPEKFEMKQPVNLNKQFCETEYNGKKGQWNEEKNTCDCPDSMVWNSGIQKCEDSDLSALQDACWKIRKQATWDEEKNECVCNDENKEYKDGKCVKKKTKTEEKPGKKPEEKPETKPESKSEPQPKPKPKERTDEEKAAALAEKKSAWDDAKETEQSLANRTLTAATTAATGIGAMQLAQGLTEQKADAAADRDMTAYMATMRCSYADGKSVKAGVEEIELPGGNDAKIMKYRNEYFALADSLKERKESLGMKPGIESEVILDKADMGLYDDENVGITGGNYASLYRAKTGSESDQALITSDQEASANRVKYGAIALGAGAAVGIVGNSLINGKLGEWIKGAKDDKDSKKNEDAALKELKQCLKDAGTKNYDKLNFSKFTPSVLNLDGIDCKKDLTHLKGKDATTLFADSEDGDVITKKLVESFGEKNAAAMLGKVVDSSGKSVYVEPTPETVGYTATGGVKQTRFESDKDYGDGVGYCYNFIDGFVRGEISSADCNSLTAGDWMTYFSGGNVKGISVCSAVRPDNMPHGSTPGATVQTQIQNSYDSWVENGRVKPANDAKVACYCKKDGGANWVFDSYFSGYSCRSACAYFCAYLVKEQDYFRDAVLK